MEYILLIHNNARQAAPEAQWNEFFTAARSSGVFSGGSAISPGELVGATGVEHLTHRLAGHMRFNTSGTADGIEVIHQLLQIHPTVLQGGTVELCEMPRTG